MWAHQGTEVQLVHIFSVFFMGMRSIVSVKHWLNGLAAHTQLYFSTFCGELEWLPNEKRDTTFASGKPWFTCINLSSIYYRPLAVMIRLVSTGEIEIAFWTIHQENPQISTRNYTKRLFEVFLLGAAMFSSCHLSVTQCSKCNGKCQPEVRPTTFFELANNPTKLHFGIALKNVDAWFIDASKRLSNL